MKNSGGEKRRTGDRRGRLQARVRKEGGKRGTEELTRAGEGGEHENKSTD